MIMSVSTLIIGRTAAIPVSVVNFCMGSSCDGRLCSGKRPRFPAFQAGAVRLRFAGPTGDEGRK
jgi:hypothetical protein